VQAFRGLCPRQPLVVFFHAPDSTGSSHYVLACLYVSTRREDEDMSDEPAKTEVEIEPIEVVMERIARRAPGPIRLHRN